MKRLTIALVLTLVLGCSLLRRDSAYRGLTDAELDQVPDVTLLPDDAGYLFSFIFKSRDLTEDEMLRGLRGVIIQGRKKAMAEEMDFDTEDKVVIFAYEGKTVDGTATADYRNDEVELWMGSRSEDHYVRKTYRGAPDDVLAYLREGYTGSPEVTEGKSSEELRSFGKKDAL